MFYIVATPIGNLEDLSLRQARIIASADFLLVEDTRSAGILLEQIAKLFSYKRNPQQKMSSYYKEREFDKLPEVIERIRENPELTIAIISDSGMPLISDPGQLLVKYLADHRLPYTVVPGPSAVTAAFVMSGFKTNSFQFIGFLPKKKNDLLKLFTQLISVSSMQKNLVFIAYESPNRIIETLSLMDTIVPLAQVAICRELTKKFEEVIRGLPGELAKREYKGEIVLVFQLQ